MHLQDPVRGLDRPMGPLINPLGVVRVLETLQSLAHHS
jgi:hypothetical protein